MLAPHTQLQIVAPYHLAAGIDALAVTAGPMANGRAATVSLLKLESAAVATAPRPQSVITVQTRNPMTAIATLAMATKLYPKTRLREKQGTISLTTAIEGRIMMYTAGCE